MKTFIATFDLHYGFERKGGHKVPLHDEKAWNAVVKFAQDFRPDTWILGGDFLDCGSISHHNKNKPGQTEGFKLAQDAEAGKELFINPVVDNSDKHVYMVGNHERWLLDLVDERPALEGILEVENLLDLDGWQIIPQGGALDLGKLTFIHGDTISGGEHVAKAAVINYERSIRFGHFHTYQTYTKTSPQNYKNAKTGIAVPCLCTKTPGYGAGKPNKWVQGFNFGYIHDNGFFNDYVATIIDGKFTVNGKTYKG